MNFDLWLFNLIHRQARKSKILDFLAITVAEYIPYVMIVALLIMAYRRDQWHILLIPVTIALFARFFLTEMVYVFYKRRRPVEVLPIQALIKKPSHPSLPSGHATFFFALALATFLFSTWLAILFLVTTVLVCLARIFCGVHWPADILAGFLVATVSVLLFHIFL